MTTDPDIPADVEDLTAPARERILALYREGGLNQTQIAKMVKRSPTRVSQIIAAAKLDTREDAKTRLNAAAEDIAMAVIKGVKVAADKGDVSGALEILDRQEALPTRRRNERPDGPKVVVIVGNQQPTVAALPAEFTVDA